MERWSIDASVAARIPGAAIGFLVMERINAITSFDMKSRMREIIQSVRENITLETLYQDELIQGMRRMYRKLGMDPARYRPASERLIRRILKGKGISGIHPVVDACNIVSIQSRLPLGLYDLQKVKGNVTLRFGETGESYLALTGIEVSAQGKFIVADENGPIGSPTTDSDRTKVDDMTGMILLIVYGPPGHRSNVEGAMNAFSELLTEAESARKTACEIYEAGKET